MAFKLEVYKKIECTHIAKLAKDIKNLISEDTLGAILSAYINKIKSEKKLVDSELKSLLDWHSKIEPNDKQIVSTYLNSHLESEMTFFEIARDYFDSLRLPEVVDVLSACEYISQRMSELQSKSYENFLENNISAFKDKPYKFLSYVENLYLVESDEFTIGQKSQAQSFVNEINLSETFENEFDRLLLFYKKSDLEYPQVVAKTLDKQLGFLISKNEAEVTAKAYNQKLGYQKYIKFVEIQERNLNVNVLVNFKKLKSLMSKFDEAINILANQEQVRGQFWKLNVGKVDAIKFKKVNHPQYKVAVAFLVGDFVFCDYGPTGNKIYIYDKDIFEKTIQKYEDWKISDHLTSRLFPSSFSHIGDWQNKTLGLMTEARRK